MEAEFILPRDSQGAYSLPAGTLVSTGDTIMVGQHNPAMSDIAQAVTNSLSRDGQGGMRSNLNMGGFKVTGAAEATNPSDAVTKSQLDVLNAILPVGTPLPWFTEVPPANFILAFGQAVSRAEMAALFAVYGTRFGVGDGSTTFNMPDLRGLALVGKDDMGGTAAGRLTGFGLTLGATGGAQTHTLSEAEIPSHKHEITTAQFLDGGVIPGGGGLYTVFQGTTDTTLVGGGQSHNNVQPSLVCNWMVRAR